MHVNPGFLPLYWDAKTGKLYLEIGRWNTEILYYGSLAAGLGSNGIGLDRGQLGPRHVVRFVRVGPKVLLIASNYGFRAMTSNPDEARAVKEAFAESALWGFSIEAEEDGKALVDATAFFLRDSHGVAARLRRERQGDYRLDASRSAIYLERTKNFPRNTEIEATLTFTGEPRGAYVREVAPDPGSLTLRLHHSFVELPGPGYEPRLFDPRAGYINLDFFDYATPVTEPIRKQFLIRHRLKKQHPAEAVSEPEKPIVYYLDRGAPEPIRQALLDGARWWERAFEAAGYRNAFRVEMLPEGADPLDIRYNVIQWVHRSTRGWSYGSAVVDPRTGEILKGHVTLGSLRVRQDFLIAEGLLAPYEEGRPANPAALEMALARLRQLSAHEVGHTLGLAHNFAASARDRASVMDYPHPLARIEGPGAPDLSAAYTTEIGEWDKVAIAYGYGDFGPEAGAQPRLRALLDGAHARGLYFLSDADARPEGGAHPEAHLWDNGADAAAELDRVMAVRARVLERFSLDNLRPGAPVSELEKTLVPIYLLHRYQTEAAAKVLGGLRYTYAVKGDGQTIAVPVAPDAQRRALTALLATVRAETLTLDERVLRLLPPPADGYPRTRETFRGRTGVAFDALAAAEAAAHHTLRLLLHPQRAARLIEMAARDPRSPGLLETVDKLFAATWQRPAPPSGLAAEVERTVEGVALHHLILLAANESAPRQANAIARAKLDELRRWLAAQMAPDPARRAHHAHAADTIRRFLEEGKIPAGPRPAEPPPGQPIGASCEW